jgi:heptosyltransferase-3
MLLRFLLFLYQYFFPDPITLIGKRIILAKVNRIGDVTMSLPLASALKKADPTCKIIFLGGAYTKDLIELYADVDEFADWDKIKNSIHPVKMLADLKADIILIITQERELYETAYKARIPVRVGTLRTAKTWLTCTHFVNIARNKAIEYHESQLDMMFLRAFNLKTDYTLPDIIALRNFRCVPRTSSVLSLLHPVKFNLVLNPKTHGQHQEWPESKFLELISQLDPEGFNIFVTGTTKERLNGLPSHVHDMSGRTSLKEMIELIAHADGLIAASTGPVHLAANFRKWTLGLYTKKKPQSAVRWGPVGPKVRVLTASVLCSNCRRNVSKACVCLNSITVKQVLEVLRTWQGDL